MINVIIVNMDNEKCKLIIILGDWLDEMSLKAFSDGKFESVMFEASAIGAFHSYETAGNVNIGHLRNLLILASILCKLNRGLHQL